MKAVSSDSTRAESPGEQRMKAVTYTEYGSADVLRLTEIAKPVPTDDELLIRIHAVSINGSDREALAGRPLYTRIGGLRRPGHPILGSDIAGRVEAVGAKVRDFQVGDEIFGELPGYFGGFAEYVCASEKTFARKPATLTFDEAASLPQGGVIALRGIMSVGQVQPGQRVLINGAGGSAGVFAVQLARMRGAEVTAVDSAEKSDFLRSLGADHVIDYTTQDFTRTGKQYDLILELIAHRSVFAYARALRPGGTCFFVGGSLGVLFQILLLGPLVRRATGRAVRLLVVPQNRADLLSVTELCEAGGIIPIIDRRYTLSEVPEAMRYVAEGRQRGKVVITIDGDGAGPPTPRHG
jgi:NADPH:quinone reductase-like Zn-dependent oxidoreductase